MSIRTLVRAWNEFFFKPQSPTPIALYRILYGLLVIADLILLRPDWFTWYGTHAIMSMDTLRQVTAGPRINLFLLMPQSDAWINAYYWVFLAAAVFLTLGFLTRFSSVVVFLCLISMHQRNVFMLNAGDGLLRINGFFLMFAPAGAALSIDRLIRVWRGQEGPEVAPQPPWAQRMIQFQMSVTYLSTFWWKTMGKTWIDGTALYYTMQLDEFRRFPVPAITHPLLIKFGTWSALLIEFWCGVLVWFKETRYIVLLLGLLLQMSIEYSMNIPLFEWIIVATYVTFIYPEDLTRAWTAIRTKFVRDEGKAATVIYDGAVPSAERAANVLRTIDILERLQFVDAATAEQNRSAVVDRGSRLTFLTRSGAHSGFAGLATIAPLIPLLWPIAPAALFQTRSKQAVSAASPTS